MPPTLAARERRLRRAAERKGLRIGKVRGPDRGRYFIVMSEVAGAKRSHVPTILLSFSIEQAEAYLSPGRPDWDAAFEENEKMTT